MTKPLKHRNKNGGGGGRMQYGENDYRNEKAWMKIKNAKRCYCVKSRKMWVGSLTTHLETLLIPNSGETLSLSSQAPSRIWASQSPK